MTEQALAGQRDQECPSPSNRVSLRRRIQRRWRPEPDCHNEFPYSVDELTKRLLTPDTAIAAEILEQARSTSEKMVEERVESVERRAATLQGTVAVAGSFVLTGGTLLVSQINGAVGWRLVTGGLLLLCVTSFTLCGLRATQAASEWQRWSIPARAGIFDVPADGVALSRILLAARILHSAGKNSRLARLKVTLLRMAVWHLRNALLLLVAVAAHVVLYAAIHQNASSNEPNVLRGTTNSHRGASGASGQSATAPSNATAAPTRTATASPSAAPGMVRPTQTPTP